ncbi:hypothetical protein SAMN04515648_2959 [Phyllobacterium sp. CL33Tsu]|uniref:hypothetical protein n=1 Tax=Phyllobacterium sp. CL33Tsu TaxID=1798191 RepID=UPI0008DF58EA|nr:hypothetical protein [Phyllobacterium sp. CL33Tsu]SFJ16567.1 hypothetical protein SAMN04515648_2959 [Phyllobacterium sp. CL33Tsu]
MDDVQKHLASLKNKINVLLQQIASSQMRISEQRPEEDATTTAMYTQLIENDRREIAKLQHDVEFIETALKRGSSQKTSK